MWAVEAVRRLMAEGLYGEADPWPIALGLWSAVHGHVMLDMNGYFLQQHVALRAASTSWCSRSISAQAVRPTWRQTRSSEFAVRLIDGSVPPAQATPSPGREQQLGMCTYPSISPRTTSQYRICWWQPRCRETGDQYAGWLARDLPAVRVRRRIGSTARALAFYNEQWKAPVLGEALAIVSGPDAYISPSAYASKREHGRVVPTWNYVTAHVYGKLVIHDLPRAGHVGQAPDRQAPRPA